MNDTHSDAVMNQLAAIKKTLAIHWQLIAIIFIANPIMAMIFAALIMALFGMEAEQ